MKKINFLLLTIVSLILLVSITSAQVSHPASEITFGTFGAGDFIFPDRLGVNLGIGVPSESLEVIGNINLKTTSIGTDALLKIESVSSFSAIDFYDNGDPIWGFGKNPSNNFYIDFSKKDDPDKGNVITIDTDRNVGIGTSDPKQKLDVNGLVRVGRFTTASRPACDADAVGGFVFDTTIDKPFICSAVSGWKPLDSDVDEDKLLVPLDPDDTVFHNIRDLDADLTVGNIKSGVDIFGVIGTFSGASLPPVCTDNDGGSCIIATPTKSALDLDLKASNIKKDEIIFGVTGNLEPLIFNDPLAIAQSGIRKTFEWCSVCCGCSGSRNDKVLLFDPIEYDPRNILNRVDTSWVTCYNPDCTTWEMTLTQELECDSPWVTVTTGPPILTALDDCDSASGCRSALCLSP